MTSEIFLCFCPESIFCQKVVKEPVVFFSKRVRGVSGWGQTGPYAHKPGFGSLIEGMSGFAAMTGFAHQVMGIDVTITIDVFVNMLWADNLDTPTRDSRTIFTLQALRNVVSLFA